MIVHRARPWSSIKAHSWVCDKVQYYCFIPYLLHLHYLSKLGHASCCRTSGWVAVTMFRGRHYQVQVCTTERSSVPQVDF